MTRPATIPAIFSWTPGEEATADGIGAGPDATRIESVRSVRGWTRVSPPEIW
jgi:hypothetical protein